MMSFNDESCMFCFEFKKACNGKRFLEDETLQPGTKAGKGDESDDCGFSRTHLAAGLGHLEEFTPEAFFPGKPEGNFSAAGIAGYVDQ